MAWSATVGPMMASVRTATVGALLATVPRAAWFGVGALGLAIVAVLLRFRVLDRIGSRLAGEAKARREALARTGTTDGVTKVARFAAMLADPVEVRLIRWTPARTTEGMRIALGASPAAWYLWLPEPAVLLRIPDSLVAKAEHVDKGNGVAELHCEARAGAGFVTATDGLTVEEADESPSLARSLLHGLVFVDPRHRPEATPSRAATASTAEPTGAHEAKANTKVGSVSLAS